MLIGAPTHGRGMVILAAVGEKHDQGPIIRTAYDLARAFDEELEVLHVIPEREADDHFRELRGLPEFSDLSFDVKGDRAEEVARRLIAATLEDEEADLATPAGEIGDPADRILDRAAEISARFLVVGGKQRSPAGKAIFGSTTQSVILAADDPVVTVKVDG